MRNTNDLSPKQHAVIAALLSGARIGRAAKACGVARKTVSRWMLDEPFTAELHRQRAQVSNALTAQVMTYASSAARTLREMAQGAEKEGDRIRAAGLLLGHALGSIAQAEQAAELAALTAQVEKALQDRAQQNTP